MRVVLISLCVLVGAGCGPDVATVWSEQGDEGVELVQGELTASAMLAFVNGPEASVEVLDLEVGLDGRVAWAIFNHVRGPDGALGTADDDLVGSIAELDAIPNVGPAALAAIDRYATPRYGLQDMVVEGVRFSGAEATRAVEICNDPRLDQSGLTSTQRVKLAAARPHTGLATVAATWGIGSSALTTLRNFAASTLGPVTPPPPVDTGCAVAGKRDGVLFSADEACKAVEFLNTARTSDMWRLPRNALDFVYFGGPNRPLGAGTRSRWSRLNEYTDAPGVGTVAVQALYSSLASWKSGGPTSDTVVDAWARRADLVDLPVRFDRVYVSRTFSMAVDPNRPWIASNCGELRDSPTATTWVRACFTRVAADSATGCQARDCFANTQGTWVQARGEFSRSTTPGTGGYVLWLTNSGFGTAAPH